jgi:hypothetical protein
MTLNTPALIAILQRSRTAIGHGIGYEMGQGGTDPEAALPSTDGHCDCSGFVAWCLHLARKPKPGRNWWIETTAVWKDATGPQAVFTKIDKPVAGCCVVYPDHDAHQGHIGIVANPTMPYTVVDCSESQDGIKEHMQTAFMKNRQTIFCVLKQDTQ